MFIGSKGGGSASFKQTPDNLRSNDTFEGVLGLCVGPIKGPKRGLKSIKINDTALENASGQQNFEDFVATFGDGDPLKFPQKVQLKLGAGAAPSQVGITLGTGVTVTRTLANINADFVDMRFIAQQLFRQDAKGQYNATATLKIEMKPVGSSTWINPTIGTPTYTYQEQGVTIAGMFARMLLPRDYFDGAGNYRPGPTNYAITGKTSSPAVYELRIGLPNDGAYANTAWDIRVTLIERDSYVGGKDNADQEKRTITWESMAAVYGTQMGDHEDWRGLAWLQLYGKASDALTGVPEVTGEYDTKIVSVPPSNIFNPATRAYTAGVWDGSWVKAFTTDPAWVINDAISDSLSGLSLVARGSYLNKWDALELSKYCSELVPNGNGGTHPRYNMNLTVTEPQKAEEFIRYLAGAVGALAWDQGNGEWRVKVDKADNPVDLFTLDNIEGEFLYSHTDVDTRFNDITGKFKNAAMDYREDAVQLFDNTSIALIGRKPTTIALVGCTDRQEAMRRVKLRLRSTVNENRNVTFTLNRRGRNIEPLSTVLIADGDLGDLDKQTTGRIVALSADRKTVTLRDPVYLAPGIPYKLWFAQINPSYSPDRSTQPTDPNWKLPTVALSRTVTNAAGAGIKVITLDTALPTDIDLNANVALEAPGLPTIPRLFRVISVMPQDDGERVSISAINIDTGKWSASDNVSKQDTVFQDLRGAVPPPETVNSAPLLSLVRILGDRSIQIGLQASWVRPAGAFISGFRVRYSVNGGAMQTAVDQQQTTTWELPDAPIGTYYVEVTTMDRRGGYSLPLTGTIDVTQSAIDELRNRVDAIYADNLITAGREKERLIADFAEITALFNALSTQYSNLGSPTDVTPSRNNAVAAMTALGTYLNTLSPAWNNAAVDTPIVRDEYKSVWQTAHARLATFSATITGRAGSDGASVYNLVADTAATLIEVNKVSGVGGGGWGQAHAHTIEKYKDGAVASWIIPPDGSNAANTMAGLTTHPNDYLSGGAYSYFDISFAIHRNDIGQIYIYSDGNQLGPIVKTVDPKTQATRCQVKYDGLSTVFFYVDDVEVRQFTWAFNQPLAFSVALASNRPSITDITFAPMGARGANGTSAYSAILSNEAHPLPADKDGNVTSYAGASTSVKVFYGALDVTSYFSASIVGGDNPQNLSLGGSYPNYTLTGGVDANEDSASITFTLTGTAAYSGVILKKTWSFAKSRAGTDGSPPPLITLTSDKDVAAYDTNGTYVGGPIRFTSVRQNIPGPNTYFKIVRVSDGAVLVANTPEALASGVPSYFAGSGGDLFILSATAVRDYINAYGTIQIVAYRDGYAVVDTVSIGKVQDGAPGVNAPLIVTQWSVDGLSNWHPNYAAGDLYQRQSNNGGTTFGAVYRVIGEDATGNDGVTPVIVFRRSATAPASPVNNTGLTPSGWSDGPPPGGDILWQSKANFLNNVQQTVWSTPVRITGPDGPPGNPGTPATVVTASTTTLIYLRNSDGSIKVGSDFKEIVMTMKRGDVDVSGSATWSVAGVVNGASGFGVGGRPVNMAIIDQVSGNGYADFTGTYLGVSQTVRVVFTIQRDAAPPAGNTSLSTAIDAGLGSSQTSYPAGQPNGKVLTVAASPSGQLQVLYYNTYYADYNFSGNRPVRFVVAGIPRYRIPGGTWIDFPGGENVGSDARGTALEPIEGTLGITRTVTGLSANIQYEVGVAIRCAAAANTGQVGMSGDLTVRQPL
jgi:predicted phage tail protein